MTWIHAFAIPALLSLLRAPATPQGAQASCPTVPAPSGTPFADSLAGELRGTFRLTMVTTTYPGTGPIIDSSLILTLGEVDSARRAQATERRMGFVPRKRLLLEGSVVSNSGDARAQPAEIDDGILYLGCRDCMDASPAVLQVQVISEAGFWGSWRDYQTGIGYVVDREGRRAPDPAGPFCAIRVRLGK